MILAARAFPAPLLRPSRILRLAGPAFAVAIGYIDPGNWVSDLAAGSYRFALLWALLLANGVAIVLQLAVTKITIRHEADLATLVARRWPSLRPLLGITFVGAAMATDLAEFTGIVLGAQLLFGLSVPQSVAAGLAVIALLLAAGARRRVLDVIMVGALAVIGGACVYLAGVLHPDGGQVLRGIVPSVPDSGAILVIVAIIGATVMPHNLFLHSALIDKRCSELPRRERAGAERFFTRETLVALNIAAVINAAILIVGACLHGSNASLQSAYGALALITGNGGSALFGLALLVSGIAASLTATLSGDYIFAAFSPVPVPRAVRRAATIIPTAVVLLLGIDASSMLLWSQVALCLALPVALFPLLGLLRQPGDAAPARRFFGACVAATTICVILDIALLVQTIHV